MHLIALLLTPAAALLAPATQPAAVPRPEPQAALRPEEVAFLDAITCDARDLRQAEALYAKYGVVRLRKAAASPDLRPVLLEESGHVREVGVRRRAPDRPYVRGVRLQVRSVALWRRGKAREAPAQAEHHWIGLSLS